LKMIADTFFYKRKLPLIIGLCLVLVAAGLIGFYFYSKTSKRIPSKRIPLKTLLKPPRKQLEVTPPLAKKHYLRGKEYYYKKEFDRAISEYKESIKIKPTAEAYCELAVSYMEKEDFKTAIEKLKESIKINPEYPKSEYAIAVCYIRIKPPDLKLAREHFERSKKLGYHPPEWFERHLRRLEGEDK